MPVPADATTAGAERSFGIGIGCAGDGGQHGSDGK
jgi:hypothetical protein